MDQKYERIRILGVGGNRSARRKPTKAGMESANQIHIQPLLAALVKGKCSSTKPGVVAILIQNRIGPTKSPGPALATGVVCHPNKQNRPYKIPWPCRGLNRGPTERKRELYQCATLLHTTLLDIPGRFTFPAVFQRSHSM